MFVDSCVAASISSERTLVGRRIDCLVCEACILFLVLRRHVFVLRFGQRQTKRGGVGGVLAIVCFDMCCCGEEIDGATCRLLVCETCL